MRRQLSGSPYGELNGTESEVRLVSNEPEEMMCQECGKKRATIHLTDFRDGQPVQKHLCEECYGKKEGVPTLTSTQLLAALAAAVVPELQKMAGRECPACGTNLLEFQRSLALGSPRLGCPKDYEVFQDSLDELLRQMHGANRHVGKVPVGAAQKCAPEVPLEVLRRELEEAVRKENFERAARLRDQIKNWEQTDAGRSEEQAL